MGLYCWAMRPLLLYCREDDRRAQWPRYQKEAFEKNLQLVESVKELADKKGCIPRPAGARLGAFTGSLFALQSPRALSINAPT